MSYDAVCWPRGEGARAYPPLCHSLPRMAAGTGARTGRVPSCKRSWDSSRVSEKASPWQLPVSFMDGARVVLSPQVHSALQGRFIIAHFCTLACCPPIKPSVIQRMLIFGLTEPSWAAAECGGHSGARTRTPPVFHGTCGARWGRRGRGRLASRTDVPVRAQQACP